MADEDALVIHGSPDDWPDPKESIGTYLLRRLQELGDRTLQIYALSGEIISSTTLVDWSTRYAATLRSHGVQPGDMVVVCSAMHPHMPALMLGTLLTGATFTPLNYNFDEGDLQRLLGLMQPRVVFTLPQAEERLRSILQRLQSPFELIILGEGPSWERFLRDSQESKSQNILVDIKDLKSHVLSILCSSGTTGLPKGVCLSHYNTHVMLDVLRRPDSLLESDHVLVVTTPMYWATGLMYTMNSMDCGSKLVYAFGATEEQFLEAIMKYKATTAFTASNFILSVAKHSSLSRYDLSSLQYLTCGGASMSVESQLFIESTMGVPVYQYYGMTEVQAACGLIRRNHHKPGSVGQISPYLSCRVVNSENGQVLGRGSRGEFQFRGALLTPGYLRNPEATAAMINSDGWLGTGDMGYVDEDGYLFVTGRIKDLIKYRGDHIAPVELETILMGHPGVKEAAVVAVPNDTDQEHPRAYVVLQPGSQVTAKELEQLIEGKVASYKWLRGGVYFLDKLPKSSTGKIRHAEIRRTYVQAKC